ncbi:acyl-CoA dehydrogenase domain-containing protein [Gemmatirosa kalamazoonensis]|uniref:Acyl-CoA dehydrogenase domain-containing protein n=1 Tax=Gemmatirosa kalamazoonensis TaxID=861299 RepID=W0REI8_9BACT|nr:acyl-CoA dehydrogenase family protein [Gemmatirosa kalamazoonensis]AHG89196.1 acyl-CoA dehydrogenase domain-containing protein [Gemmatirosa kalamazoonensis]
MTFFQPPPSLGNTFTGDAALRSQLRRLLPADVHERVEPDLERFGARAAGDLLALADAAEAEPPRHVPYDAWGRRVDRIETSEAWRALDRVSAEEGLVAIAYERALGSWSRVHQLAKLYLFHPSSATYSCPLAMTDGAARCLARHGAHDAELADSYAHLTSRDPARFWTSGQWMTERTGGSDVSRTSTVAVSLDDGTWRLHGVKWFTSATTAQMALALGRTDAGLSLFQVRLRDADGALRGIRVERLKEKLGTRALPTAELTLDGAPARLVGEIGRGVRTVAEMLNVTRVYNAVCAAAGMRRGLMLARDYATRREAFGRPLIDQPLHAATLADLELEARGALALVLHVAALLGREECGDATGDERAVLRLLTPVAKLLTGRQAVAAASETLEAFGGAGYVEDTGLPRLLRDAQVLAIWEGTTNVLSLDVLRAIERDGSLAALLADATRRVQAAPDALSDAATSVGAAVDALAAARPADRDDAERGARAFAMSLGRTVIGALLLEHATWATRVGDVDAAAATAAARRWCARDLAPRPHATDHDIVALLRECDVTH